jgi:hypothetical protein
MGVELVSFHLSTGLGAPPWIFDEVQTVADSILPPVSKPPSVSGVNAKTDVAIKIARDKVIVFIKLIIY